MLYSCKNHPAHFRDLNPDAVKSQLILWKKWVKSLLLSVYLQGLDVDIKWTEVHVHVIAYHDFEHDL